MPRRGAAPVALQPARYGWGSDYPSRVPRSLNPAAGPRRRLIVGRAALALGAGAVIAFFACADRPRTCTRATRSSSRRRSPRSQGDDAGLAVLPPRSRPHRLSARPGVARPTGGSGSVRGKILMEFPPIIIGERSTSSATTADVRARRGHGPRQVEEAHRQSRRLLSRLLERAGLLRRCRGRSSALRAGNGRDLGRRRSRAGPSRRRSCTAASSTSEARAERSMRSGRKTGA